MRTDVGSCLGGTILSPALRDSARRLNFGPKGLRNGEFKMKKWLLWKLAETASVCKLTPLSCSCSVSVLCMYLCLSTASVPIYEWLRHLRTVCTAAYKHGTITKSARKELEMSNCTIGIRAEVAMFC